MGDTNKNHDDISNSTMSLGDHLEELRWRLIHALIGLVIGTTIGFCFGSQIITFIETPYIAVMGPEASLTTLDPAEGFTCYVKIAFISGLLISSPWVFYHLWMFIAAGLYPNEKKYVYIAAPFSAVLFITGSLFFMFFVAPLTLGFLVKFNQKFLGVSSQFNFQMYISFITNLMLVFGLAFQTPTAIFFLNRTGLVSLKTLAKSRKYVLLIIVIVAAIATPPDVASQITLAIPLYLLFELGIFLSYLVERKKAAQNNQ